MKIKLKGWQFLEEINANPYWALQIPEGQEIIVEDFVYLNNSKCKGLGSNITFEGISAKDGTCAVFENCEGLTEVRSTFLGPIKFIGCALDTTEHINLDHASCAMFRVVASFKNCYNLHLATGEWPGPVDYSNSSIKEVKNLTILQANNHGEAAIFDNCKTLEKITGSFPGMISACSCPKLTDTKDVIVTHPNQHGTAALFRNCQMLSKPQGKFKGFVDYKECPILKIDPKDLQITQTNREGMLASFWGCPTIELASGEWEGALDFSHASIKSTKGLKILKPNLKGISALFCSAQTLEVAEGIYYGGVDYSNSSIKKTGKLKVIPTPTPSTRVLANFENCENLTNLPSDIPINQMLASKNLIHKTKELLKLKNAISKLNELKNSRPLEI